MKPKYSKIITVILALFPCLLILIFGFVAALGAGLVPRELASSLCLMLALKAIFLGFTVAIIETRATLRQDRRDLTFRLRR